MTATELPAAVRAAVDAANAHDTDAYLATFADDGAVDDWSREFRGRDAICGWSEREFIGVGVTLTVTDVKKAGSVTTVSAHVGGRGFNGPSTFTFTINGGLVARMAITA